MKVSKYTNVLHVMFDFMNKIIANYEPTSSKNINANGTLVELVMNLSPNIDT